MTKDVEGTVVPVFGIKVDKNSFMTRFQCDKLHKAYKLAAVALNKQSMMLLETKTLTGFLFLFAKVVRLGWVFLRSL